jgi:hypothetical protein
MIVVGPVAMESYTSTLVVLEKILLMNTYWSLLYLALVINLLSPEGLSSGSRCVRTIAPVHPKAGIFMALWF